MAAVKRNVAIALAAAWVILLGAHLWTRLGGLAERWPRLRAGAVERAELESGNPEYHAFLTMVAKAVPPGSRIVLLAYDPRREDLFEYYRAEYELFPTWAWFAPIGFPPTGRKTFTLPVDPKFLALIQAKGIALGAVWNRPEPAKSGVYALTVTRDGQLKFGPPPPFAGAPAPVPVRVWGWGLGLAVLIALGWGFNAVTGLAAPFGGDVPTRLAFALMTGSGLTALWMLFVSLAGVPWSLPSCLAGWLLLPAGWWWRRRRGASAPPPVATAPAPEPLTRWNLAGLSLVAASAAIAGVEAVLPMSAWGNWDAWAIWNLKARAFGFAATLPKAFLQEPLFDFMHPDYPPGLPLVQTFMGLCAGGMHESLLRGLSVAFHLMLAALLARLLLELGAGRVRWLLAGGYALIPKVLEQASSGYADLLLSAELAGALVCLVRVLDGRAPAWTAGLACGLVTLIKGEGLIWAGGFSVLFGIGVLRGRVTRREAGAALALLVLFAAPWRLVIRQWQLTSTFRIDGDRLQNNLPEQGPVILKAALLEASGIPITGPMLTGRGPITTAGWWTHLRDSWLPLWYAVAAGLMLGLLRLLSTPFPELAFLVALQLGASWAVYLGAQFDVVWVCLTSIDRLLLQAAPLAFALAAGASLGRSPAPPPVSEDAPTPRKGKRLR